MSVCKFDNIFAFHLQTFLFHLMKGSKPASNADPSQLNSFPHILNPSKMSEYTVRFCTNDLLLKQVHRLKSRIFKFIPFSIRNTLTANVPI